MHGYQEENNIWFDTSSWRITLYSVSVNWLSWVSSFVAAHLFMSYCGRWSPLTQNTQQLLFSMLGLNMFLPPWFNLLTLPNWTQLKFSTFLLNYGLDQETLNHVISTCMSGEAKCDTSLTMTSSYNGHTSLMFPWLDIGLTPHHLWIHRRKDTTTQDTTALH